MKMKQKQGTPTDIQFYLRAVFSKHEVLILLNSIELFQITLFSDIMSDIMYYNVI